VPNYGFAIDLRKCIGCHACTIACKAEHQIPIGVNRCWVKTVEQGTFPRTQRFFLPVLCNQCDDAPCMRICPTNALFKRPDGIVDLLGDACIGCRACMAACPYDQLFIDPGTRTAEKCNFCANRVENQLLPACVSVCPTECRIFGDLDDPATEVARIAHLNGVDVRKPEKNTIPKVFYLGAEPVTIKPELAVRPFIYKEGQVLLRPLGAPSPITADPGDARVDYDVPHVKPWGFDMALYLLAKGIATGTMLVSLLLPLLSGDRVALALTAGPAMSLVFLIATAVILVVDLERPERFYYILIRPNWQSWLVWGAYFLTAQGALTTLWLVARATGFAFVLPILLWPLAITSVLATCYTGFLFAQARARDLWQGPVATIDLLAQAIAEGAAVLLILAAVLPALTDASFVRALAWTLAGAMLVHVALLLGEHVIRKSPTRHHALATDAIRRGPYARLFWLGAIAAAAAAIGVATLATHLPIALAISAVLALASSFAWEYVWVEAGQCVPLS